jgi:hypothetical protein
MFPLVEFPEIVQHCAPFFESVFSSVSHLFYADEWLTD